MRRLALAFSPVLLVPVLLAAQTPERGGFIVRLGSDTIAVERFSRTATQLEGDVVARSPRAQLTHYVATLGPDGRINRYEASVYAGATGRAGPPLQGSVVTIAGDTAIVLLHRPRGDTTMKVPVRPGAVPMPPLTFAFYEQMARQARREHRDTLLVDMVFPGSPRATQTTLRVTRDSAVIDLFGLPAFAHLDNIGRVLDLDGRQTTDKVVVERVDGLDADAYARSFAAREAATGPMGQLSPRDTARATIGGATIAIDYGRPHQRGRVIFGGVVPWNQVWRTGANAATQLMTDRDLVIGGTTVPAGTYTLWTLPSQSGAQLIINREHGQWGTEYHAEQDLARIPLTRTALAQPVEQFTMVLEPSGAGGVMRMRWEGTEYAVPFTVK